MDALALCKDAEGEIEVAHLSNLTKEEAIELVSVVGALVGLGIVGEDGLEIGAVLGAEAGAGGLEVFCDEDAWDVIDDIPNDSAAALILIEHHWAVALRDAVASASGVRISDGFIDPIDLVAVGLVAEAEAEELAALSNAISYTGSGTSTREKETGPCRQHAELRDGRRGGSHADADTPSTQRPE